MRRGKISESLWAAGIFLLPDKLAARVKSWREERFWQKAFASEYRQVEHWLTRRRDKGEVEREHLVTDDRLGPEPVPFGWCAGQWYQLLKMMRDGDEIWEYCSDPDSWERLAGQAGIALVRNGRVIRKVITEMN